MLTPSIVIYLDKNLMLKFKLLLMILTGLMQRAIKKNLKAAAHAQNQELIFQIQTTKGQGRYYIVKNQRIRSHAGRSDKATFTLTFSSAKKGFAVLSAKDSTGAFLSAVGSKDLIISGDYVAVMWFQGLVAYL